MSDQHKDCKSIICKICDEYRYECDDNSCPNEDMDWHKELQQLCELVKRHSMCDDLEFCSLRRELEEVIDA